MLPLRRNVLLSVFVAVQLLSRSVFAYSSGGYGNENSLFQSSSGAGSYGGGSSGGGVYGKSNGGSKGPVEAAVESHRTVEIKPVQMMSEPHEPQVIEVPSDDMPVTVHFKSQSSRVLVQQTHTPAKVTDVQQTSSEDEPQRVIHEVLKPVIQEIREVIQPYRRLIQQIQPVLETTHTVIATGEPRSQANQGAGGSGGGAGNGGNYAASASTVTLKQQAPVNNQQSHQQYQQQHQQETIDNFFQQKLSNPQQVSYAVGNDNAKVPANQGKTKLSRSFTPTSSVYSSRRGDFAPEKPTKTRITLRPAPTNFAPVYKRARVSLQGYQPQIETQRAIEMPIRYERENYFDMSGGDENVVPFITFIAQPTRYRARARA